MERCRSHLLLGVCDGGTVKVADQTQTSTLGSMPEGTIDKHRDRCWGLCSRNTDRTGRHQCQGGVLQVAKPWQLQKLTVCPRQLATEQGACARRYSPEATAHLTTLVDHTWVPALYPSFTSAGARLDQGSRGATSVGAACWARMRLPGCGPRWQSLTLACPIQPMHLLGEWVG